MSAGAEAIVGKVGVEVIPETHNFRDRLERELRRELKGLNVGDMVAGDSDGVGEALARSINRGMRVATADIGRQSKRAGRVFAMNLTREVSKAKPFKDLTRPSSVLSEVSKIRDRQVKRLPKQIAKINAKAAAKIDDLARTPLRSFTTGAIDKTIAKQAAKVAKLNDELAQTNQRLKGINSFRRHGGGLGATNPLSIIGATNPYEGLRPEVQRARRIADGQMPGLISSRSRAPGAIIKPKIDLIRATVSDKANSIGRGVKKEVVTLAREIRSVAKNERARAVAGRVPIVRRFAGREEDQQGGSSWAQRRVRNRRLLNSGAVGTLGAPAVGAIAGLIGALPALGAMAGLAVAAIALGAKGIKDAAGTLSDEFGTMKSSVEDVFRSNMADDFERLAPVMGKFTEGMKNVATGVTDITEDLSKYAASEEGSNLIKSVMDKTGEALTAFAPTITTFADTMLSMADIGLDSMPAFSEGLGSFFEEFKGINEDFLSGGLSGLGDILGGLGDGFNNLYESGLKALPVIGPSFGKALDTLGQGLGNLVEGPFSDLTVMASDLISSPEMANFGSGILEAWNSAFDGISQSGLMSGVRDFFNDVGTSLSTLSPIIGPIATAFGDLAGGLLRLAGDVLSTVADGIRAIADAAADWDREHKKRAEDYIEDNKGKEVPGGSVSEDGTSYEFGGVTFNTDGTTPEKYTEIVGGTGEFYPKGEVDQYGRGTDKEGNTKPPVEQAKPAGAVQSEAISKVTQADLQNAEAMKGIMASVNELGGKWSEIRVQIEGALPMMQEAMTTALTGLQTGIDTAFTGVTAKITERMNQAVVAVSGSAALFTMAGITAFKGIQTAAETALSQVKATVTTKMNEIVQAITASGPQITSGISDPVTAGHAAISGLDFYSVGATMMSDLAAGINDNVGLVTTAMNNAMAAASKPVPESPADEGPWSGKGWIFKRGERMMTDLAGGINRKEDVANTAMNDAMEGVHKSYTENSVDGSPQAQWDKLTDAEKQAKHQESAMSSATDPEKISQIGKDFLQANTAQLLSDLGWSGSGAVSTAIKEIPAYLASIPEWRKGQMESAPSGDTTIINGVDYETAKRKEEQRKNRKYSAYTRR